MNFSSLEKRSPHLQKCCYMQLLEIERGLSEGSK
jgi:hypothetical protein